MLVGASRAWACQFEVGIAVGQEEVECVPTPPPLETNYFIERRGVGIEPDFRSAWDSLMPVLCSEGRASESGSQ